MATSIMKRKIGYVIELPKKIPRILKPKNDFPVDRAFIDLKHAGELNMRDLPIYEIPMEFIHAEFNNERSPSLDDYIKRQSDIRLNAYDYINGYKAMLFLEEAAEMKQLSKFKHSDIKIEYDKIDDSFYFRNGPLLSTVSDAYDEKLIDTFILVANQTSITITGRLSGKNESRFFCWFKGNAIYNMHPDTLYEISFHINRQPYQLMHHALNIVFDHNLFPLLIRNPLYTYQTEYTENQEKTMPLIGSFAKNLNDEQTIAVRNIVNANNMPLPYVVFGPPGTGKTRTLVAAIEEIVRTTSKNVLVCANSNSACDELTGRLASVLTSDDMFRLYSKTSDARNLKEFIRPMCNLRGGNFTLPSLQFLYQFRVLICTLGTAGCLSRARVDPVFKKDHFSYVFIDECASTHEPMALNAIAGVCTSFNEIHSSIILAGDPKQLDAVTKSANSASIGFKTSFLEHLANSPRYKRHPERRTYDTRYITQLVKNYRSHLSILRFSNSMFYENSLQALAPPEITNWYIGSDLLPSKNFPIIFKSVQGKCQKVYKELSSCNIEEVKEVVQFIKELLSTKLANGRIVTEADIGIVTPYKLQCRRIGQACRANRITDVTIGTAEKFQGQEKPIMIVSTVRAGGYCSTFVNDPRRLNVIITRAKCLLIIVGDPHTLSTVHYWKRLIRYCFMNNALIQSGKPFIG